MIKRLAFIVLAAIVLALAWELITFPDTAALATERPKTTAFMDLRRKQLRADGKDTSLRYQWVPYEQISPYLRRAVLVAEDDGFYEHQGVEVKAMREALERDWKRRKLTHGGSTITQQLAKNLYLSPSRNPVRKLREYFIARSLERNLSKKRILELYLNVVEMGERVYGAEAASRFYFKRSAKSLTASQAALLAGCLPNPRVMVPGNPNKRLRSRQKMILSRMRRWGYLVEREMLTEKKPQAQPAPAAVEEPATDTSIPVENETAADAPTSEPPAVPATSSETPETVTDPVPPTSTESTKTDTPPPGGD